MVGMISKRVDDGGHQQASVYLDHLEQDTGVLNALLKQRATEGGFGFQLALAGVARDVYVDLKNLGVTDIPLIQDKKV